MKYDNDILGDDGRKAVYAVVKVLHEVYNAACEFKNSKRTSKEPEQTNNQNQDFHV